MFEKINSIGKPIHRLTKKKRERTYIILKITKKAIQLISKNIKDSFVRGIPQEKI